MTAAIHRLDSYTPAPAAPVMQVVTSRFVTIELAEVLTGFTQAAIRAKIAKGIWIEGKEWVKRDGRVLIDMKGYERWAEKGRE